MNYTQEILKQFDEKFPCKENECNNNGIMLGYDSDGDIEQQQCQYCFECRLPQKDFIAASIAQVEQSLKDTINEKAADEMKKNKMIILSTTHHWRIDDRTDQ